MNTLTVNASCVTRVFGFVTLTILTAACSDRATVPAAGGSVPTATTQTARESGDEPVAVQIVRVVEQSLDVPLSLPGELTAFQSVAIFPRVAAFVKSITVDRGSQVRAGEPLVLLDAPELVAQRAEAESKVQAAEAQLMVATAKADADRNVFERLKAAAATPGVVAGNDVLVAEKTAEASASQVLSAQHAIDSARQALLAVRDMENYLKITAPFDGIVTERNVHTGALVGPAATGAAPLLRVVDSSRLRLVVPVPEAYSAEITANAEIPFTVAAHPGHTFVGRIARVAQAVDVSTRTMATELDVMNGDRRLLPGTFCQVRWPIHRSSPSLFVPSTSVAATTDRMFVTRIRDGKVEWIDVRTGLTSGALVEVFGDLRPGDQIAIRGTDELRPGTEVRAQETKAPA